MAFNELALAARGDESHLEGTAAARGGFLCMLHRNEPGWFVGEHMHVRDGWDFIVLEPHFVEAMEWRKYEWYDSFFEGKESQWEVAVWKWMLL